VAAEHSIWQLISAGGTGKRLAQPPFAAAAVADTYKIQRRRTTKGFCIAEPGTFCLHLTQCDIGGGFIAAPHRINENRYIFAPRQQAQCCGLYRTFSRSAKNNKLIGL